MARKILKLKKPRTSPPGFKARTPSSPDSPAKVKVVKKAAAVPVNEKPVKNDPPAPVKEKPVEKTVSTPVSATPTAPPTRTKPAPSMTKALALLTKLETNHPELFPVDENPPRPWAIGIHKAIQTRYQVSKRVSRLALKMWLEQNREAYRRVLVVGGKRFDLNGEAVGEIIQEEVERLGKS